MNGKNIGTKVIRDIDQTKADLAALRDDSISGLTREYEHLASNVKRSVADAAQTVNQTVGTGLSQYNDRLQEVANELPGDLSRKATEYIWVTASLTLMIGLLLGLLLKPGRQC